jgi:H+-transporting ATPase
MRLVLGMASVLGLVGPIAAFGLFYLGDKVFHLDHPELQTMMYLTLSVAGHLTIFLTRTRGPFWSIRPARVLWLAVLGTQMLATLIAVSGVFMTALNWRYAALVWGYAIAWFLLTDRAKLLAYRILDPIRDTPATNKAIDGAAAGASKHNADADAGSPQKVGTTTTVAPFHTDSDENDPVYHDNGDCAYGQEIVRNGNSKRGKDGRRRCDWCAEHDTRPAVLHAGTSTT